MIIVSVMIVIVGQKKKQLLLHKRTFRSGQYLNNTVSKCVQEEVDFHYIFNIKRIYVPLSDM